MWSAPRRSCEFTARALLCLAFSHTRGLPLSSFPFAPPPPPLPRSPRSLTLSRTRQDVHVNLCVGSSPTKGPYPRPRPIHHGPEMMHRLLCLDHGSLSYALPVYPRVLLPLFLSSSLNKRWVQLNRRSRSLSGSHSGPFQGLLHRTVIGFSSLSDFSSAFIAKLAWTRRLKLDGT